MGTTILTIGGVLSLLFMVEWLIVAVCGAENVTLKRTGCVRFFALLFYPPMIAYIWVTLHQFISWLP